MSPLHTAWFASKKLAYFGALSWRDATAFSALDRPRDTLGEAKAASIAISK
jgi:hypothetical protein